MGEIYQNLMQRIVLVISNFYTIKLYPSRDDYALQLACQSKKYLYLMNTEIIPNRCDRYQKIK